MSRSFIQIAFVFACLGSFSSLFADPIPERITIATWNLEWFFDDYTGDNPSKVAREQSAPSKEAWEWKLSNTTKAIGTMAPTVLCLQEVESRRTVFQLVKRLREEYKLDYKIAFVEGTDVFTEQDVCVLTLSGLVEFGRREQTKEMWASKDYYDLQKHVFCTLEWGTGEEKLKITLLNVHMRAMEDNTAIRIRQGRLAHTWLRDRIRAGEDVILIGDTNTNDNFEDTKPTGDSGVLRGLDTPEKDDDLFDLHELLKPEDRATHIIHKQFDRILISDSLQQDAPNKRDLVLKSITRRLDLNTRGKEQDKDHWDIYYKIPDDERDISDHFPLVAEFEVK